MLFFRVISIAQEAFRLSLARSVKGSAARRLFSINGSVECFFLTSACFAVDDIRSAYYMIFVAGVKTYPDFSLIYFLLPYVCRQIGVYIRPLFIATII